MSCRFPKIHIIFYPLKFTLAVICCLINSFQYYHKRKCVICKRVPKDPTVCLMCGTFLCLRGTCCKKSPTDPCETVKHSIEVSLTSRYFVSKKHLLLGTFLVNLFFQLAIPNLYSTGFFWTLFRHLGILKVPTCRVFSLSFQSFFEFSVLS